MSQSHFLMPVSPTVAKAFLNSDERCCIREGSASVITKPLNIISPFLSWHPVQSCNNMCQKEQKNMAINYTSSFRPRWTFTPQHWRHLVTRVRCRNSPFDDEKRGAEVNSDASLLNRIAHDYFHLIKSLLKAASPFRVCEKKEKKKQEISTRSIENLEICEWVSLTLQMHGTRQKFKVQVNC